MKLKFAGRLLAALIVCLVGLGCLMFWPAPTQAPAASATAPRVTRQPATQAPRVDQHGKAENQSATAKSQTAAGNGPVPEKPADPPQNDRHHPSDALLATAELVREQWSVPDAVGNRERTAIFRTAQFKYPWLRVVERWSGKSGKRVSRVVMVADHVLVAPRRAVRPELVAARLVDAGFVPRDRQPGIFVLASFAAAIESPDTLPEEIAKLARLDDIVEFAEPDYLVWPCVEPNDPAYPGNKLWGLNNPGGVDGYAADADIDAPEAWDIRHDASGVVVAVTDTGIRHDHEDLAPNMWHNPAELAGDGIDNDGNGVIDDVFGYDAINGDGDPMDDQGHGTHCAGIIGARGNNGIGITGVAWNVQLMGCKFLGPYGGTTSDGIKVIDYARQMGANVISASWGGGGYSQALKNAIASCATAGIPFVAAAGNDGVDNDSLPHYPSSYDLPNVVAVAATDATDKLAYFSCYGRNSVDIAAPGWQIWSTYKDSTSDYKFLQGTSMATPYVTGALALARAQFPLDTVDELIYRVYQSADVLDSLNGRVATGGRLNLQRLLATSVLPQSNDVFGDAFVLRGDYAEWSGGNQKATREANESTYSPAKEERTLWYAWSAARAGYATIRTHSLGIGQRMVVFRGSTTGSLVKIIDSGPSSKKAADTVVRFLAEAGTAYRIVTASDSATGEMFSLSLELTVLHDQLSQAALLEGESFDQESTNRGATAEPFESKKPHGGVGGGHSVWFRWAAPSAGPFTITTDGSGTDTVVAVYTGNPQAPTGFHLVAANDDTTALDRWSKVEFNSSTGTIYWIAVDTAQGGTPGIFQLHGRRPGPPVIAAQPLDITVSPGERAVFSVGAGGTPQLRFQWFRDDQVIPGAWDKTLVIDPVRAMDFAGYHVTVTNDYGTATSATARLIELRKPPSIVWRTGDLPVVSGSTAVLGVRAEGSDPITYQWAKDGQNLSGQAQPFLTLAATTLANNGVYSCTVSNDAGSAIARMTLSVANSPFDSFAWVRDNAPNSPITDMKVINGKCYAVAGERILVSTDGRGWTPWLLPPGFDGWVISQNTGKWYCAGTNQNGLASMTVSTDGVIWSTPVAMSGLTFSAYTGWQFLSNMESVNGRLVAACVPGNGSGTWYASPIYHSTDGITWTRAKVTKIGNSLVDLSTKCRFEARGGKLYLPGDNTVSSVIVTTDGQNWQESALPLDAQSNSYGEGIAIGTSGGRLSIVCKNGAYSTADGTAWTRDGALVDNTSARDRKVVSAGGTSYLFTTYSPSATYRAGSSPVTWTDYTLNPTGANFSAAVEFDGAVIFGTTTGLLRRIDTREDFRSSGDAVYPLSTLRFVNDEFLAYRTVTSGATQGPVFISGDGRQWRPGKSFSIYTTSEDVSIANLFIGGRYYGNGTGTQGAGAGWIPGSISSTGLPSGVTGGIATADDGTQRLVVGNSQNLYSVTMDGSQWTKLPNSLSTNTISVLLRFNGNWFFCATNSSSPGLYRSQDGISWTNLSSPVPINVMTEFNGKLCGVNTASSTFYESADGISWQSYPLPTGLTASLTAYRLLSYEGRLILLTGTATKRFVFYSTDGRTWFNGNVPSTLRDIAVGKGLLVGITSTGGVLVTGSTGAGGAAPLVRAELPSHNSYYVAGTTVEITGSSTDPEGLAVTTECQVDGVSIGSSTGPRFRFTFKPTSTTGHVISLRGRDPQGLVGSDELKISAIAPQLRNDFESVEGKSYLPTEVWASFGGRAYAGGGFSLYRTRDDGTWESVLLPSLTSAITNLVSGNGTLIVQAGSATFLTRDGVNWSQITTLSGGKVYFQDGWFVGFLYNSFYGYSQTFLSRDGLTWTFGFAPKSGGSWAPSTPTVTPGGALLTTPPYRSPDGGVNWIAMPEFGTANSTQLQFASAFGAVFAGLPDGRILRSTDDGRSWTQAAQFPALATGHYVRIAYQSGRIFWGGGGYWLGASSDGTNWQSLAGEPLQSSLVAQVNGRFVGFGRAGMVWSSDGFGWQSAAPGPANPARGLLVENGNTLLLGDTNGGAWHTEDGKAWTRVIPGKLLPPAPAYDSNSATATRIKVGSTTVVGGGAANYGFLWNTTSDGLEWNQSTYNGGAISGITISNLWSNGTTAFAATKINLPENRILKGLWRSFDGRDWQQLWSWSDADVVSMVFHNGEWLALGGDGQLRRSTDGGNTWSADFRPAQLLAGRLLVRFDNAWIIFGTEAANLQGPNFVYVSTDNGQTWTRQGAPGSETSWSYLASATKAGVLVVTSSSGKVYTASDRNLAWTNTATLSAIYSGPYRIDLVGGKFCILGKVVSDDGFTWTIPTKIGGSTVATPVVQIAGVYVTFPYYMNPFWSLDGLNWTESTGGSALSYLPVIAEGGGSLRARDISGAVWQTLDGKAWTRVRDGLPDISNTGFARRIVRYGNLLLATGTGGLLLYSEDDGRSWQPGLVDGRQLSASISEREIKASPTEMLASFHVNTNYDPPICRHFRSTDGRNWTELPDLAALNVMDYAWADGAWLAIRHNGGLLRSTDGGLTWSDAGPVTGVLLGRRVTRFQGLWVVAGTTTTTGSYPPIQLHTSPDGITWTNRGDSGSLDLADRSTPPLFFTGNGFLHFGRQPSVNNTAQGPVKRSVDGITWADLGIGGNTNAGDGSGNKAAMFLPLANGYLAFGSSSTKSYYWKAPATGGSWGEVPPYQNQIKWVGSPDGERLFLFGPGIIKEWTQGDLELTMAVPSPVVAGVGDSLSVTATLRNTGAAAMTDPVRVNAWLSSDRFYGDGNDTYLGQVAWPAAVPAPGAGDTRTLSFTLPSSIRPGTQYLVLELQIPATFREANRANNVAIASMPTVTIPQRQLMILTDGEGTVSSDQIAEYYPQGARIAFIARPGKGARFAGWGGDALGALSETMVILNSDKTVMASFVSTAALTVFTQGGGDVTQSSGDGTYLLGVVAELHAQPHPGWTFGGWSGAASGSEDQTNVVMNANQVVTAVFNPNFDLWTAREFSAAGQANPLVSGPDADPDGDGIANWREWLRGSNPQDVTDRGMSEAHREGAWLVLTYSRLETMPDGHDVKCEASPDLNSWNLGLEERILSVDAGVETIEARVDISTLSRGFMRTSDTRPSPTGP